MIVGYDDHGWKPWTVFKTEVQSFKGNLHYYHNLIWVKSGSLYYYKSKWAASLAKMIWKNNILIFETGLDQANMDPQWVASHNYLVAAAPRPSLQGTKGGFYKSIGKLGFTKPGTLDFTLTAASPAVNACVAIAGINDTSVGLPDIGPFERGKSPGANWPRPRKTVFKSTTP